MAKYEVRIDYTTPTGMKTDILSKHRTARAAYRRMDRELALLNRPCYAAPQSIPRLWVAEAVPSGAAWSIGREEAKEGK